MGTGTIAFPQVDRVFGSTTPPGNRVWRPEEGSPGWLYADFPEMVPPSTLYMFIDYQKGSVFGPGTREQVNALIQGKRLIPVYVLTIRYADVIGVVERSEIVKRDWSAFLGGTNIPSNQSALGGGWVSLTGQVGALLLKCWQTLAVKIEEKNLDSETFAIV